eukprot:4244486-Amphidinium_carterae.1
MNAVMLWQMLSKSYAEKLTNTQGLSRARAITLARQSFAGALSRALVIGEHRVLVSSAPTL